ncbi:alpha/beta fold hydrolase [Bryobacter aggregatus]|uniref:alpha/beta fold hydrolase n=1 Tax=Bryobacter aggregatus TaxID=360054 RepID=UPI0004E21105|nr:alpha/beta hydrolase [Bryobacter aggregatus]
MPLLALLVLAFSLQAQPFLSQVQHDFADSHGVRIHYATYGKPSNPLILMVHGFPDFWYTWRDQMQVLGNSGYYCAAMDLRGYNLSGQPTGAENYDMRLLLGDLVAVIRKLGREKAIVMAHDWGGAIAWQLALHAPQYVDKLIILNLPHPNGFHRELANNPDQQKASEYARKFQQPDSQLQLKAAALAGWVKDPEARKLYVEALKRSSLAGMMAYYQRNYPKPPYQATLNPTRLTMPVLEIHGLKDTALLASALNGTWDWIDDFTLVTIPEAGHFVQQDATGKVSQSVKMWLGREK